MSTSNYLIFGWHITDKDEIKRLEDLASMDFFGELDSNIDFWNDREGGYLGYVKEACFDLSEYTIEDIYSELNSFILNHPEFKRIVKAKKIKLTLGCV